MLVLSSNRYYELNRIPKLSLDNYLELVLDVFVDSFDLKQQHIRVNTKTNMWTIHILFSNN